jgi:hypothetical protein
MAKKTREMPISPGRPRGAPDKKKRRYNPKSLANLKPFPKGASPNPGGLPKDNTPVARWINILGSHTLAELKNYLKPRTKKYQPVNKLIAVRAIIRAERDGAKGEDIDRVCDRQTGKPKQETTIRAIDDRSPAQLLEDARRRLLWKAEPEAAQLEVVEVTDEESKKDDVDEDEANHQEDDEERQAVG